MTSLNTIRFREGLCPTNSHKDEEIDYEILVSMSRRGSRDGTIKCNTLRIRTSKDVPLPIISSVDINTSIKHVLCFLCDRPLLIGDRIIHVHMQGNKQTILRKSKVV